MIKYRLACDGGHEFEGWFKSGAAYDDQAAKGHITCPHCGSLAVTKAIMAPNVATRASPAAAPEDPEASKEAKSAEQVRALMRQLRTAVEEKADYVGPRFAEEARKIHYEESEARGIYGEASADEAKALVDEGIAVFPLPRLREDLN
jgi:hypothetical protein